MHYKKIYKCNKFIFNAVSLREKIETTLFASAYSILMYKPFKISTNKKFAPKIKIQNEYLTHIILHQFNELIAAFLWKKINLTVNPLNLYKI